jgi:hypothetical protein
VNRHQETFVEKELKCCKRHEKSRKKQEKSRKKAKKKLKNSFHRWMQINADVQKI